MQEAIANRLIDLGVAVLGLALILIATLAPEGKHLDSLLVLGSLIVGNATKRLSDVVSDMRKPKEPPTP